MKNNKKKLKNDVYNLIISRRSIRRYKQKKVKTDLLKKLVNSARLAPSAANLQPLEYIIINDKEKLKEIFKTISWAGYLKDWNPSIEESPTAYILILSKQTKNDWYIRDSSLAAENIILTAENEGLGSCIILKFEKEKIRKYLKIPKERIIDSIIALGYKSEKPIVEDIDDSVKYWRDKNGIVHVPKRKLEDILHINKF